MPITTCWKKIIDLSLNVSKENGNLLNFLNTGKHRVTYIEQFRLPITKQKHISIFIWIDK